MIRFTRFRMSAHIVLVCRKLFHAAAAEGKGSRFKDAFDYVSARIAEVQQNGVAPASTLYEVAAEIVYRWRVHRSGTRIPSDEPIEWARLLEFAASATGQLGSNN